jgi:hypothetical protein
MADFQIKIRTTAEGTGAQQTAADLDKLKTGAQQTAQPIGKLTEETDKAGISKGKLAVAVQKLAREFPILYTIASAIKHPIIGVAAVIGVLVQAITKQIQAQKELAAQRQLWGEIAAGPTSFHSALIAGMSAADAYIGQIRKIGDEAAQAKTKLDTVSDAIRRQAVIEAEQMSAEKGLALAQIDLEEKEGKLTPLEAIQARKKLDVDFEAAKQKAKEQELAERGKHERAAAAGMLAEAMAAEKQLPAALAAAEALAEKKGEAEKAVKIQLGEKGTLDTRVRELGLKAEQLRTGRTVTGGAEEQRKELENLQELERYQRVRTEVALAPETIGEQLKQAQDRVAELRAQSLAGRKGAASLTTQAEKTGTVLGEVTAGGTQRLATLEETARVEVSAARAEARAKAAEEALKVFEKGSERWTKVIEEIARIQGLRADHVENLIRRSGSGG